MCLAPERAARDAGDAEVTAVQQQMLTAREQHSAALLTAQEQHFSALLLRDQRELETKQQVSIEKIWQRVLNNYVTWVT